MRRPLPLLAAASWLFASAALAQTGSPAPEGEDAEFNAWAPGQGPASATPPRPAPVHAPPAAPGPAKKSERKATPAPAASDDADSDWSGPALTPPPVAPALTPPPAPPTVPPSQTPRTVPRPPAPPPGSTGASATAPAPPPRQPNHVSLYSAPTLGEWKRGLGAYIGFPLLGVKVGLGLTDSVDVGLGFDSFYSVMNEPRAWAKYNLARGTNWAVSLQLEGGAAFFTQRPEAEGRGARWLTGRRNFNVEPGVIVSYRGDSAQSARLFLDARYHAAFDTQPYTDRPLGGVPPPVVWGHNVPIRMGAEMPFSPTTSFLFVFGFDIHGRDLDAPVMPSISVGLVTGL